ncbi:MAG: lysylphosphatidylglycerol synthase transmembrane domain-containing protein [bacterium]
MKLRQFLPALRILVSLGLLFLLYRRIDLAQVRATFAQARPGPVALLYALLLLNTVISAFKWKQLLKADGSDIPLRSLVGSYLVGGFLNLFLPSNIGGDAYRVYYVANKSKRTAHSFASVLADRLSGFVVLVLFGFVFGLVGFTTLPSPEVLWIPAIATALLVAAIGTLLHRRFATWCIENLLPSRWEKLRDFSRQLLESVQQYRTAPGVMAQIMTLSFLFQFNACVCIYVLARGLSLDTPFIYFLIFVPFISLLEALPISIYGLGIRDNAYVLFFTTVGMTAAQAAAMALAYVIMTLVYCSSGGLILLLQPPRQESAS